MDTEEMAVCKEYDRVSFLDLKTGEFIEENCVFTEVAEDAYRTSDSYLSYDGHYLLVLDQYGIYKETGTEYYSKIRIYDREKKEWKELPQELQELKISVSYTTRVWMGKESNRAAVYDEENQELILFDLEEEQILQRIPFNGKEVWKVVFWKQDTKLLLWSDNTYLRLWDIEKNCLLMEDTKRLYRVSNMHVSEENDLIWIRGYDEDSLELYMGDKWMSLLYSLEDDHFYPFANVINGFYEDGQNRIGSLGVNSQTLYWFKRHSLDELLEQAREVVGDAVLTRSDKMKYFIEE